MAREPKLATPRATVRLASHKDCAAILAYYRENEARFRTVTPTWPQNFLMKEFWTEQIDRNMSDFYSETQIRLFVFRNDAPNVCAGNVSLSGILRGAAQFCYMGYGIAQENEGTGLMKEAVTAVISYAFEEMNLHRLMANYMPANERSAKLLERLGFVVEGTARQYLLLNGRWEDHVLTSLTNEQWAPRKGT